MAELKDCPCCGGPGQKKTARSTAFLRGWVGCPTCGLYIQWAHDPASAIEKWNRRAGTAQPYDLLHEEGGVDA